MKALTTALLLLTLQILVVPAHAQDKGESGAWLKANPSHRAIFCGEAGFEEASKAYSDAMSKALDEERGRGRTSVQAIVAWRAQFCAQPAASTSGASKAATTLGEKQ